MTDGKAPASRQDAPRTAASAGDDHGADVPAPGRPDAIAGPWTLTLHGRLPTLNETLRMHPMQRVSVSGDWYRAAYWACKAAQVPALGRALVTLTRYAPGNRQPDADNLAGGGAKFAIDGIKGAGVVADDSPRFLRVEYRAVRCAAGSERVVLVIGRWEEGA